MASVVEIWNLACGRIGERTQITSETTDQTEPARWCRTFYYTLRDSLLAQFDWAFARRVFWPGTLPTMNPPPPWAFALAYPPECLAVLGYFSSTGTSISDEIDARALPAFTVSEPDGTLRSLSYAAALYSEAPSEPFRVAGETASEGADTQYVLALSEGGFLRFTRRVPAAEFSGPFTNALAWFLAADVASAHVRSEQKAQFCLQMAARSLDDARLHSSRQERVTTQTRTGLSAARY